MHFLTFWTYLLPQIYTEANQSCVRLTSFMRFLITLVRLLEQRPSMSLHELKTALNCGLNTTFEFGYPNLYSVIVAHDDLFTVNNGPTQERSDITLNVNCNCEYQERTYYLYLPYIRKRFERISETFLSFNLFVLSSKTFSSLVKIL